MNTFYKNMIISCVTVVSIATFSVSDLSALSKNPQQMMGANPYTWSPRLFDAENGVTGRYWAGNGTKKYPGKAYIEDTEYTKIVVIKKNQLNYKKNKNLRKHKDYLGSYIDASTNIEYYLYGVKKNPEPIKNGPDSDVITQIAIELDYGIGE